MADGVDTLMDPMEQPPCDPPADAAVVDPDAGELRPTQHAVLPRSNDRDAPIADWRRNLSLRA
jgi:hypothetical protein